MMKASLRNRVRSRLLAALLLTPFMAIAFLPGIATAQQTGSRTDAQVQSDVTAALGKSSTLKYQSITAATINGNVTLSGNVSDAASKELAESLALRVSGVNAVSNNLTINGQRDPGQSDTGSQLAADGQQLPPAQDGGQAYPQDNTQSGPQETQQNAQASGDPMGAPGDPMAPPPGGMQGGQGAPRGPYGDPASQYPGNPYPQNQYPQNSQSQYPPSQYPQNQNSQYPPNQYPQDGAVEQASSGPVEIPQGTLLKVRLSELLDAHRVQQGTMFEATAATDVYSGGVLAIPRGAVLDGQVVEVKSPKGSLAGSSSLTLKLNNLVLNGRSYALDTDVWSSNGPGKGGYSASNTVGGAAVGAIIGGIAGGGPGAAIGAAAGGATGAAASAATSGPRLILPPEAILTFHLATPLTVQPVSYQEAQRLASASRQQNGPGLQRRGYGGPGYGYPGYGYPPPVAYGYYPYGYYPYGYYYPRYRSYYYGGYYRR